MATTREALRELWRYRYLLQMFARRELKVRYKNSALGLVWSIIPPLMQLLVYTFLFKGVLALNIPNYAPYLLCGLIPWTFFSSALMDSSQSLLVNMGIIKKVYLPREIIPLSLVISNAVHLLISWTVFFVAFLVIAPIFHKGIPLLPSMLLFPVITLMLLLLTTGLALWISALNVFYEDVKFIVVTLLGLAVFLMPVLYPADLLQANNAIMQRHPWLFKIYMLNPVASIIDAYRKTLLEPISVSVFNKQVQANGEPLPPAPLDWTTFGGAFAITLLIAYGGYWYFNRRKWQFVERS